MGFALVSAMRRAQPHASRFISIGYPRLKSALDALGQEARTENKSPTNCNSHATARKERKRYSLERC